MERAKFIAERVKGPLHKMAQEEVSILKKQLLASPNSYTFRIQTGDALGIARRWMDISIRLQPGGLFVVGRVGSTPLSGLISCRTVLADVISVFLLVPVVPVQILTAPRAEKIYVRRE